MIQINDELSINENELTKLIKVEDRYFILLSSGERLQISEELFNELKGGE